MKSIIKKIIIAMGFKNTSLFWILSNRTYLKNILKNLQGVYPRECPCCGFHGKFVAFGNPPRYDARCPQCSSLERHRLLFIIDRDKGILDGIQSILHFAPEQIVRNYLQNKVNKYTSADLFESGVDLKEDIENISLPSESMESVLCSHVLEHVDDKKALKSIYRILKPGGKLIAMVPICEGWEKTYENPAIKDPVQREIHFGQQDHVRYYGRDFIERMTNAGFEVTLYTAKPDDCIKYGLIRGEKIFVGKKT
jgi:predicted SAM-dependent methyltransferase